VAALAAASTKFRAPRPPRRRPHRLPLRRDSGSQQSPPRAIDAATRAGTSLVRRRKQGRGDDPQVRRAAYAKPIHLARVLVTRGRASGRSRSWHSARPAFLWRTIPASPRRSPAQGRLEGQSNRAPELWFPRDARPLARRGRCSPSAISRSGGTSAPHHVVCQADVHTKSSDDVPLSINDRSSRPVRGQRQVPPLASGSPASARQQ
jgi:hypothetical protein